tara:strand:+ start:858 stop:1067 length:210 start_codon:yes stop_codon:yes gene_type:complete
MSEENKIPKRICVVCNKTIKTFSIYEDNPSRKIHRSCWLKTRSFEDRKYDHLFTGRKINKKCIKIKPSK